ncbi:MAG: NAD-dependent epimerase/dehydratase family protein [Actinomycetota bacterium]
MRVVITGATGNVGTSLVEALSRDPAVESIVGVARRRPEWLVPKTTWVEADVGRDDLDPIVEGADAVVHLAWLFQPTHDPLITWRANALGSIRLFESVGRARVPTLVHASSVGAYSPAEGAGPVDETWPTHALPTAAYGREKSYVERALDGFEAQHPGCRVVRLRPGFIFKRESASEQRRLFAGPLLPSFLGRPSFIPVVPALPGLQFQALHTEDAAEAYRLALLRDMRGAFNVAADPVLDPEVLGHLLDARPVPVPVTAARAVMAAAWHLHLIPAEPALLDLALSLPVMDTTRARTELGWTPRHTATEAISEFLAGLAANAGMPTPPLDPAAGGRLRRQELASGVGERP